jgi:perosamine synthetase
MSLPTFIPVNAPLLDGNEKKYLLECIDSGWISSEGPFVKTFEEKYAEKVGRKYGIAVSNGSAALDAAIAALGITSGDEVIMPTFTIISCASAIIRAGAIPVLIDADPETWNLDIEKIEAKITAKTKAIMAVHIYGIPVDMDKILALAKTHNLLVIEDAAELQGQYYKDKPVGSFGDISCVSFYANKHITTGEGGMILTNDPALAEKCRSLRNLCFDPNRRFYHEELGWNFRMTNLQAALGVAQLERLNTFVEKKRWIASRYNELLADLIDKLELPLPKTDYAANIYWVYGIILKEHVPFEAASMIQQLAENGIGARPFFWCMHQQPVFNKMGLFVDEKHPVGERIARRGFYIPSGLGITEDQINIVSEKLHKILR